VKKWDDFSDLYDSLHLRYGDALSGVPFPLYTEHGSRISKQQVCLFMCVCICVCVCVCVCVRACVRA